VTNGRDWRSTVTSQTATIPPLQSLVNPVLRGMVRLRKARAREIRSTVRWFVADRKCRHPLPAPAMAFEAVGTMVLSLFRGQYY
jgi:hypothetical protein